MDWFPIAAGAFKVVALGTGMFFAIKWHYDQGKKKGRTQRAFWRGAGMVAAVAALSLLGLGLIAYGLVRELGLDMVYL